VWLETKGLRALLEFPAKVIAQGRFQGYISHNSQKERPTDLTI
jgi:hypothetical protein